MYKRSYSFRTASVDIYHHMIHLKIMDIFSFRTASVDIYPFVMSKPKAPLNRFRTASVDIYLSQWIKNIAIEIKFSYSIC